MKVSSSRSVVPQAIYRHFKGDLFQVLCVAHHEECPEKKSVVYMSLTDPSSCWIRDYDEFLSPVEPGKVNPTGQEYRFMQVTSFDNQLSLASTDSLLKELKTRSDNPYKSTMLLGSPCVLDSFYSVGRLDDFTEPGKMSYHPKTWCNSLKEAQDHKHKNPSNVIVHTMSVVVDDLK